MCEILDKVEKRGIAKGMAKGEMLKAKEVALNLRKMGLSVEMIASAVKHRSPVAGYRGKLVPLL